MHPALTWSLLGLCVGLLVFGVWVEGRKDGMRGARFRKFALAMQLGAVVSAYLVLRPGRGDDPQHALVASATAHRPLMLDIYSNW